MNDWLSAFAVFPLRALQAIALCLPTLLCGMLTAGVFRVVFGQENIQRWFGRGSFPHLVRAAGIGLLLPVCSMGIFTVLFTLRMLGAAHGPLVVLALTGPLITPWTLGYCLDRAGLL
ncbi:MAG TPA: permease [Tepidisphaeraceae bacterium]